MLAIFADTRLVLTSADGGASTRELYVNWTLGVVVAVALQSQEQPRAILFHLLAAAANHALAHGHAMPADARQQLSDVARGGQLEAGQLVAELAPPVLVGRHHLAAVLHLLATAQLCSGVPCSKYVAATVAALARDTGVGVVTWSDLPALGQVLAVLHGRAGAPAACLELRGGTSRSAGDVVARGCFRAAQCEVLVFDAGGPPPPPASCSAAAALATSGAVY
jgi:hypothetical protein